MLMPYVCKHFHPNNFMDFNILYVNVIFTVCYAVPRWPKKIIKESVINIHYVPSGTFNSGFSVLQSY